MRRGLGFLAVAAVGLLIGVAAASLAGSPAIHPRPPRSARYVSAPHATCFIDGQFCDRFPGEHGLTFFVTR
jgi:hypothetical protein